MVLRYDAHFIYITGEEERMLNRIQYFYKLCRQYKAVLFYIRMADTTDLPLGTTELVETCAIRMLGLFETTDHYKDQRRITNDKLPESLPPTAIGGNRSLPLCWDPKQLKALPDTR